MAPPPRRQPRATPLDDALFQTIEAVEVAKRLGRDQCVVFGDSERAKITGKRVFEVRPHEEDDRYVLNGPNHWSIHRGYYEAVKEGIFLAEKDA